MLSLGIAICVLAIVFVILFFLTTFIPEPYQKYIRILLAVIFLLLILRAVIVPGHPGLW